MVPRQQAIYQLANVPDPPFRRPHATVTDVFCEVRLPFVTGVLW